MTAVTRDVLTLIAEGLSNRAVTARPTIIEHTAGARVAQILTKPGSPDSPGSDLRQTGVARLAPCPGGAHAHPAGLAGRGLKLDGSGRAV
ncbi:hypothetical protein AB0M44_24285 [Streptosporangium subroseum]|uniref:hypothetical protein n=1 Tax=Streptosporangium subroseum TaxID=106412 RepID=UPI00343016CB